MSDPMTNVKIEDVLTSIRRLVSEVGDVAAQPQRIAAERSANRPLVLTPALRIDRETPAPLTLKPSDRVSDAEAGGPQDLLSTIAELEAAVLDQPEDWEDDGTGTDLDKTWASAGFRNDGEIEDAVEIPADVPTESSDWPQTLAEAQRVFGDAAPEPRPVFRHRETPSGPPRTAGARVDEDDHNDDLIEDDALAPEAEAALTFYLEGGGGVTREALEETVRKIVREELQGRMGERITHNVRKMVRREIARALSNGSFE